MNLIYECCKDIVSQRKLMAANEKELGFEKVSKLTTLLTRASWTFDSVLFIKDRQSLFISLHPLGSIFSDQNLSLFLSCQKKSGLTKPSSSCTAARVVKAPKQCLVLIASQICQCTAALSPLSRGVFNVDLIGILKLACIAIPSPRY